MADIHAKTHSAAQKVNPFARLRQRHDVVTLCVGLCAFALFIASASLVIPSLLTSITGSAGGPDVLLINALLLNIALIMLGWNRYKVMNAQLNARRAAEEEALRLADSDDLTGSLNRRSFVAHLDAWLATEADTQHSLAAIAIDLDNFKQVNDVNGHAAGDAVLRTAASRILALLPEGAHLARLGGDEFICAVPFPTRVPERIDHLVSLIIERVSCPVMHQDNPIDVTLSIGVAASDQIDRTSGDRPSQDLMHKADIAMYHAKKQGKNRFYWFEEPMEAELKFRNELEIGIRRGIENDEFIPYYEQQIDLDTGDIVGFEMLARWNSPELGLIAPDIFIPIAEEIGVIAEISERLIIKAFEDAKSWHPSITLSVNISPVQMRDPWFAQKILKMLVTHRFPAERLEIEITETCLHENVALVRSMITSLRNQGVRVSLDDFGTGYSSLSQLRNLPFDRLKIDRSFVSELQRKEGNTKLVDAIISMSDGLNMPITAEGIEDETILNALKQWGSMKGQGYHYGRPEPGDSVLERLSACGKLAEQAQQDVSLIAVDTAPDRSKATKRVS